MRTILLIVGLMLAGCSISPKQFVGPDGNTAYSMRCSGWGRSLIECYRKSGDLCPTGYTIIDRSSSVVGVLSAGGTIISTRQGMAIECK